MNEIYCPLCGLPSECCVCDELKRSNTNTKSPIIHISNITVTGSRQRKKTKATFKDAERTKLEKIVPILKSKLGCGGTCKGNEIILQGDKAVELFQLLSSISKNTRVL